MLLLNQTVIPNGKQMALQAAIAFGNKDHQFISKGQKNYIQGNIQSPRSPGTGSSVAQYCTGKPHAQGCVAEKILLHKQFSDKTPKVLGIEKNVMKISA